ncbi:MAPEG family protein [Sphingomonas arenae]|uniref:MAPEG family protein n=1 Tax=Sphingomonas arenae TaxID=2812555 RepID=UPI001966F02C|nr:MAPEG family protein [Sphingomonas arenae]
MSAHPLATPMAVLLAWTMVMFFWMYATRIPAMLRSDIDLKTLRGTTGRSLDDALPPQVQWKAHNYNHLLEQPTLFYGVTLLLILLGHESRWALILAWTYVALRIVHSLVQATVNIVRVRFAIFFIGSLALLGLIILALRATF